MAVHIATDPSDDPAITGSVGYLVAPGGPVSQDTDSIVEIVLPPGSVTWDRLTGMGMPANAEKMIIHGDGTPTGFGNNGTTEIIDGRTQDSSPIWGVYPNATGGIVWIYGLTVTQNHDFHYSGSLSLGGGNSTDPVGKFVVSNCTFNTMGHGLGFAGKLSGVAHHCIFNGNNAVSMYFHSWGGWDTCDYSWSIPTHLGEAEYAVYGEDNIFNTTTIPGGRGTSGMDDSYRGSRFVLRYNDSDRCATQTHPTGGSYQARGTRSFEIYGNKLRNVNGTPGVKEFNFFFCSAATGAVWDNDCDSTPGTPLFDNFITLHGKRRFLDSYGQSPPPYGWGYAGPAPQGGNVSRSGDILTWVSGSQFDVTWPLNTMIVTAEGSFRIIAYVSSTQLQVEWFNWGPRQWENPITTLGASYPSTQYWMGSNWDGNDDPVTGWPTLDQVGRGQGDLLTGDWPDQYNTNGNCYPATDACAWPNQASEPVRVWNNIHSGPNFLNTGYSFGTIEVGRDIYADIDSHFQKGNTFPGSPAEGDYFWKENEGNWRKAVPEKGTQYTGQGILYRYMSGQWVVNYTPLEYPHPYRALVGDGTPQQGPPKILMGQVLT